ncbi:hypothetical protein [Breznakia pachnodae]|uniref:Uncharacterized protein n=1 Tax=Breznakia pachnodae TaxID=265178 RepID=A0ABU0E1G7_9FIRM|nr:hypothetical protein [Breznakia pachnodae]MDQ0360732.1 hypothetical protein [Breznakia pachnodae]
MNKNMKIFKKFVLLVMILGMLIPTAVFAQDELEEETTETTNETEETTTIEEPELETIEEETIESDSITTTENKEIEKQNSNIVTTDAELDTSYSITELFGDGDFGYIVDAINTALSTPGESEWTLTQLQSIQSLIFSNSNSADFPSDLSVFTNLQSLFLENLASMEKVSFSYKNANTKLKYIDIRQMENLKSITNLDIDFYNAEETNISIVDTPKLVSFSNIQTANVKSLDLDIKNINDDVANKIEANKDNHIETTQDGDPTLINNLVNNYTYADAASDLTNQPLELSGINLQGLKRISINNAYISELPMITDSNYESIHIENSIIRDVKDINGNSYDDEVQSIMVYITNSLFDKIGNINIQGGESSNVLINFINVTANSIGTKNISSQMLYDNLFQSYIKEVGGVTFQNIGESSNSNDSYFTSMNDNYIESLGLIESNLNSPYGSSYHHFSTSIIDTIEGIQVTNNQTGTFDGFQGSVGMTNINSKSLGKIVINSPQLASQGNTSGSFTSYYSKFDKVDSIEMVTDASVAYLTESQIQELGDIELTGSQSSITIQNYEFGRTEKIGNLIINKKELPNDFNAVDTSASLTIETATSISSIGDIKVETYDESVNSQLVIEPLNGVEITIDKIGSISANKVTSIDFHDLKIKSLGQLDLPEIETLDLSGNLLARLIVKDGMFPDSLSEYSFDGNQIAGPLPVKDTVREVSKQLYNFFDITEDKVEDQSYLYVEVDGVRYEGKRPIDNTVATDLYTITVPEGSAITTSDLIELVKMYDNEYDEEDSTRLFFYHVWKYAILSDTNETARIQSANYSDEITLESDEVITGLKTGENYLELSLYDASTDAGKNENAKVYFRIIQEGNDDGEDGGSETDNGNNSGEEPGTDNGSTPDDNNNTDNNTDNENNVSDGGNKETTSSSNDKTNTDGLKTGDTTNIGLLLLLFVVSLGIGSIYVYRKIKH